MNNQVVGETIEQAIDWMDVFYSSLSMLERIGVNLIVSAIIFFVAKIAVMVVKRLLNKAEGRHVKFTPLMSGFVFKLLKVLIWIFAILFILAVWGIDLTPVVAGLGVTGVVLGFALQESISSIFSGMMLAINQPFELGDYVDIGSTSGTVRAMDIMSVTLTTPDNRKITMSNKIVWSQVITNYSSMDKRRLDMNAGVAYGTDLNKAKQVIKDVIDSYPEVLKDPAPVIEVSELADSEITFIVRPWVAPSDYWPVKWRFQKDICEALERAGIEIPYNKLDVYVKKD
ncbi:MAG: mechanosensitive ion channel family protein [Spirochaetales bacterium]|nr:mechanosensitive ion channel family protein [Spirochaetales bacterium]